VVLGVAGYVLIGTVEKSQLQQVDQELQTALPAAAVLRSPVTPLKPRPPLKTNSALSDIYVAIISKGHRNVSLDSTLAGDGAPRTPKTLSTLGHTTLRPVTVGSLSGSGSWRAVLISRPGTTQQVLVAVSMSRSDATAGNLRLAVVTAGLILLVVLAAAAFWVARLGLRPIAEVTEVADSISAGARSRRMRSLRSGTEAAHLARAFNVMLDEQEALEARLRQFVADASHELRTPVSAIQGFLQLWQQGYLREGKSFDDAVRRIGQESARMAGLVEDLLMLARLDEGQPLVRDRVSLAPLIDDVVLAASGTHPSRHIQIEGDGSVVAIGDQRALRQVIANLVTNALIHTPLTASVTIRTTPCPGAVQLEVGDTGPGMDAESAAHAFDRFWRGDVSRSRAGSGLGLPIVAGIVAAHGGQLKMDTAPGEGTVVRVVLPVA
jgi:two-component system OmpR family sensor kinase